MNSPFTKHIYRAISKNMKEILTRLLAHTTFSNDNQLLYDVLYELQDIESGWTKEYHEAMGQHVQIAREDHKVTTKQESRRGKVEDGYGQQCKQHVPGVMD
ncbi:6706_t:CDS:2 [Cetraspora pellucida]|uniref:6706_t:CDS:1 n=1 Tax=Cetraspora pellucida TaxID=1433469 RepID=A0A9N9E900_9GLOM|nr:6706_t:CDS:2 [Cetraspora pellucida]